MRKMLRPNLQRRALNWLRKQSAALAADPALSPRNLWTARRPTMNSNGIVAALQSMAGHSHRCMYCGDSEGCDIEHYKPKSSDVWRGFVFDWENFLWICAPCNRIKSINFPVDNDGLPILLDPSVDSIWDYFDFVPETGYLISRSDLDSHQRMRAEVTIDEKMTRLSHEVILNSRIVSARCISRSVQSFMRSEKNEDDIQNLVLSILDSGHPELCEWFFTLIGSRNEPFFSLVSEFQWVIDRIRDAINRHYPGAWPTLAR